MSKILNALAGVALTLTIAGGPAQAASNALQQRLTQLSTSGSGEAAYHLGMLYHMGFAGVPKDPRKAFELFSLAADRGDPLGAYKVGCFYDGQGEGIIESNAGLALKYKLVAATAGYDLAQQDVARHLIAKGDTEAGLQWLEAAAAQGSPMPLLALGTLYAGLAPPDAPLPKVPKDVVKGWAYLLLSVRDVPEMQKDFDAELAKLSPDERKRVKKLVSQWRAKPSPLSESLGIDAAYKLAGLPTPKN